MKMTFFNGAMPVFFLFEDNGYKPRLTISSGNSEIVAELTDEDQEELGNYLLDRDFEEEIEELNKAIDSLKGQLGIVEGERNRAEKELETAEEQIAELKVEIQQLTGELSKKGS